MLKMSAISKHYKQKNQDTKAIDQISIDFEDKGFYSVVGKSGSGKSTLLNVIGLLEKPDEGNLFIDHKSIDYNDEKTCETIRRGEISFVFQDYNLLPDFNVIDNIKIVGLKDDSEVLRILEIVGLSEKVLTPVRYLSGGEKQRLSIARALAKRSKIILLDEPTGNLDENNTTKILNLLRMISLDKLVIMVTHDLSNAYKFSDVVCLMDSGKVLDIWKSPFKQSKEYIVKENVLDTVNEIALYLQPLISSENITVSAECENMKYEIEINERDYISGLYELVRNHVGKHFLLRIAKQDVVGFEVSDIAQEASSSFSFKFLLQYALFMIFSKKKRFLNTLFLISISLVLIFCYMSVLNYDTNPSVYEAIEHNNVDIVPIKSDLYNDYTEEFMAYRSGKYLYDRYDDYRVSTYFTTSVDHLYQITDSDSVLDLTVVITDDDLDRVTISDFALKYIFNKNDIDDEMLTIANDKIGTSSFELKITSVRTTNYTDNILNSYLLDQDYYADNLDQLTYKYNTVFISRNVYLKALNACDLNLQAANFTLTNETTYNYASARSKIQYTRYLDDTLIFGNSPTLTNEVAISNKFYDLYLSNYNQSDIIGKEFPYKNLSNSVNANLYQDIMNIYDIQNTVKIVGIVDNPNPVIYPSDKFFEKITSQLAYYYIDGIVFDNNDQLRETIAFIHSSGDKLMLKSSTPVYMLKDSIENVANNILLFLGIASIVITVLSSIQYTSFIVTSKYKEVAIFRSLGKRKKSISLIFYVHNLVQSMVSFLISVVVGYILFKLLNDLLRQKDFLNINYDIFNVHWTSLVAPFILSTLIVLCSTSLSILGSLNSDINIVIKNS
ncbi:MAG: ATP-binding cassette domain-containing protein [Acholeplasma sp.]|nr:ATP-binding cassette domain-containing protein [Acholeplasma sp.]